MLSMKKIILFLFIVTLNCTIAFSQSKLAVYEDSLKRLGTIITNDTIELNRVEANYKFVKTLVSALKEKYSYNYPFNELKDFISQKRSEDSKFRIFTWFVQNHDGTYRYYGAMQMNNHKELELYPLIDNSQNLRLATNLSDTTLQTNQWWGSVYYQVISLNSLKNPYYILLGWKGIDLKSNSKVIETLYFKDGKPVFGTPVLESSPKTNLFAKRAIFNYTKDASMLLRYAKDDQLIVFDHLVPPNDKVIGMKELYAPDLSYDGYKLKSGKWYLQENLKLKNLPAEEDELFIDPAKDSQNTNPVIKQ